MPEFGAMHADVRGALAAAGWRPGRRTDAAVWIDPLAVGGHPVSPLAREVLAALGGLVIEPVGGGRFVNPEPFNVDPLSAGSSGRKMGEELETLLGGSFCPVGEWLSYSTVFLEAGGRMVACGLGWIWELGATFEEGLELAVRAHRPLVCLHADAGLGPWP
ncbi:SUKH-3 domain-containing protein [Spongiactinospora sp. TRM90649]|uniref:SUKH-3 domain-containing protein n=1 Tax=Spongiactinospora sp. TRM90649 TaxID=3031114 RepID=UPI0023F8D483|nr:SUKH-3 domain-containing protein [Spongiactinospora sp. TRM90649]MDF5755917.1 SUKH-3 domain-containing protein [Spongiactinospora sp. TRM90649]